MEEVERVLYGAFLFPNFLSTSINPADHLRVIVVAVYSQLVFATSRFVASLTQLPLAFDERQVWYSRRFVSVPA
jgi:hypothetical protein